MGKTCELYIRLVRSFVSGSKLNEIEQPLVHSNEFSENPAMQSMGDPSGMFVAEATKAGSHEKAVGWAAFTDIGFFADMIVVLSLSVGLASLIAYHPLARQKVSSIEQLEQPKTFIMYAMVAAVIAQIVVVQPSMALVIFGIGGLLRFRTNVGEAKDTGRVILVTVVGLCCGLDLYVIAILATVFGWVIIYTLESRIAGRIVVQGVDVRLLSRASEAYRVILHKADCSIVGSETNVKKGMISLVFKAPRTFSPESLKSDFEGVDDELKGSVDWQMS